jgi:hypothetical protein
MNHHAHEAHTSQGQPQLPTPVHHTCMPVRLCSCRCQDSQPLPSMTPPRPGRTIQPDAQYRWQLLRLAVKFHMAYR